MGRGRVVCCVSFAGDALSPPWGGAIDRLATAGDVCEGVLDRRRRNECGGCGAVWCVVRVGVGGNWDLGIRGGWGY